MDAAASTGAANGQPDMGLAGGVSVPASPAFERAAAILEAHLRFDAAIDDSLCSVVADTESSAIVIIQQIRTLHDFADKLTAYLIGSSLKARDLGKEIQNSVGQLAEVAAFIQRLPARMTRDFQNVQAVVKEIKELADMAADVRAISIQSHMLAINTAIEASHVGEAGAAFRVVSEEMRKLAFNSGAVAAKIVKGLNRARVAVESGLALSIAESTSQLAEVSKAAASMEKLGQNLEDMTQYYKTRFAVVDNHNDELGKDIAEILGQIQYQDVVRQAIERIRLAIGRRNALLRELAGITNPDGAGLAALPEQLDEVLAEYLETEAKHRHSVRQASEASGDLKIELF